MTPPATTQSAPPLWPLVATLTCCVLIGSCSEDAGRTAETTTQTPKDRGTAPALTTPQFIDQAEQAGIDFVHVGGATVEKLMPEIVCAGGGFIDYDNDNDLDVLLVHSGAIIDSAEPVFDTTVDGSHLRLYRNDSDENTLRFTDVTAHSGLDVRTYGMGVITGDVNNDGFADVYFTDIGTNAFFINNGDGTFRSAFSGVSDEDAGWSTSGSFFDYNGDGHLDLFLTRYANINLDNPRRCATLDGQREYCSPNVYPALTDLLLTGDGKGALTLVRTWHSGPPTPRPGLGTVISDFDDNGMTDIYVANDKKANQLWLNRNNGDFEDMALMGGSALDANGKAEASMGVTSGDVDGDGDEDLFITHLKGETNTLYLNQGNGMFVDSTVKLRLSASSLPATGFGTGWIDADNDADLDLFAANGAVEIETSRSAGSRFPYAQPNQFFEQSAPLTFADTSELAGFDAEPAETSRGTAFGDVDNDGDVDILVTNSNGRARLLINQLNSSNAWLSVLAIGTTSNRDAAGGRVGVERQGAPTLWRRIGTDGSFLSANDRRVHFGLGDNPRITSLLVRWPQGTVERFAPPTPNTFISVTEGTGEVISQ